MNNFTYHNPTRIVFGKGTVGHARKYLDPQKRVLLLFGGGSIKQNGTYEKVLGGLPTPPVLEFGGIEPNPEYETCMRAVEAAREAGIDFILAVGGGSVVDAAKFIAAAIPYRESDPWDILEKGAAVNAAIPLGTVLTLPGTGSEANPASVISRRARQKKLAFIHPRVQPAFSILDPETTYSLPVRQTVNGIVDAFTHVIEQYMTYPVDSPLQDRQAEAVLLTLIEEGPKAVAQPRDYNARANVMLAAMWALNGHLSCGVPGDWSTHMIGHELTAFFGIDHARTLAIVMPALLREQRKAKHAKLLQFARRVWGIATEDEGAAVEEGIAAMEAFFHGLGVETKLSAYEVPPDGTAPIVERFRAADARLGEHGDLDADRIEAVLRACA